MKKAIADKDNKVKGGIQCGHCNAKLSEKKEVLLEEETRGAIQIKGRNRVAVITLEK